jgi:cell division protein FtsN
MNLKLLIIGLIVLVAVSCRRKSSDDYEYYKPSKEKSTVVVDSSQTKQVEIINEVVPEVKGVDLSDHYFIVVASYTVEDFALAQKDDLEEQGYKPAIFMVDDDGWYKLAVESYTGLSDAKAALETIHSKGGLFKNACIVFKKNK